jgi:hypothetical protein
VTVRQSESIGSLAKALAAAQGEIGNAGRNAKNPHFKSTYADLAEIINTVRPVLARHGLAVAQFPGYADGLVTVETILTHASGEWLSGTSAAPATKSDPQGVGSAITYLRRYSLAAVCGIAQEDDDANAASRPGPVEAMAQAARAAAAPQKIDLYAVPCTEGQAALIRKMIKSHVITEEEREPILARLDAGQMSKGRGMDAIEWLQTTLKERKAAEKDEAA